jgi:phosphohistidine phosphatase
LVIIDGAGGGGPPKPAASDGHPPDADRRPGGLDGPMKATEPPHGQRILILLRHGKSAYPPGVGDHQRPLAPRGRREAGLAGSWIGRHLPPIDRVICSTAERTRQTLDATGLPTATTLVDYSPDVYEADYDDLLDLVLAIDPADRVVLIVGHGPGLPQLAEPLAGPGSDRDALTRLWDKFPTSAIAVLGVDGPWVGIGGAGTRLEQFVVPRS